MSAKPAAQDAPVAAVSRETARPAVFPVHSATKTFESYEDYLECPDRANLSIGAHADAQQLPSRAELAHYDAQRKAADATRVITADSPKRRQLTYTEACTLTEQCDREGISLVEAQARFFEGLS